MTVRAQLHCHSGVVPASAPRLPWPLVEAIRKLDEPGRPYADLWRDACAFAERNGFTRPSYEHVRRLAHRHRALGALPTPSDALADGWLRARSPQNAVDEAFRRARERRVARERIEAERSWRPGGDPRRGS